MSTQKAISLPNICTDIYRSHSVEAIIRNHIETLSKESSTEAMLLKNKLQEYLFFITSKNMKNREKKYAQELQGNAVSNHPDNILKTVFRLKSLVSLYNKCLIKLYSGTSLDSIKDIYASRTIIDSYDGKESLELIKTAYSIMDENIDYFISIGLIPCDAEPTKDTNDFDHSKYPTVLVPDRSYLSEKNKPFVKDYILHPKKKGYQSLHVIFKDTHGNYFEYQVRTYSMHAHAENGDAAHDLFKEEQRKSIPELSIERDKVHIASYRAIDNKVVTDESGFEKPTIMLDLLYTP